MCWCHFPNSESLTFFAPNAARDANIVLAVESKLPFLDSVVFVRRRVCRGQKLSGINTDGAGQYDQFHDIYPSLTTFHSCDKRLMLTQLVG